jgi:hypothetical protein
MSDNAPDWAEQLQAALEQAGQEIGAAFTRAGHIMAAQGVMGWMFQGEFGKARKEIAKLPPEQVGLLAMAARALADMADEDAATRRPG